VTAQKPQKNIKVARPIICRTIGGRMPLLNNKPPPF